jgi:hypothetical protein
MSDQGHPVFSDDMTLGEARAKLREYVNDGHPCPCCKQMAKVYERRINRAMARTLATLYRWGGEDYTHGPSLPGDTHEISQLQWWGLIEEERTERRDDGGRRGYWRITRKGIAWLAGRTTVPKYARVYDGRVLALVGDPVSHREALGAKFDYDDLMKGLVFPDAYGQDSIFSTTVAP